MDRRTPRAEAGPPLQSRGTARRAPRPRCLPLPPPPGRDRSQPSWRDPHPGTRLRPRPRLSPLPALPQAPLSPHPPRAISGRGGLEGCTQPLPFAPRAAPPLPLTACSRCPSAAGPRRRSRGLPPRLPGGAVGAERQAARGTLVRLLHGGGDPAGPTCSLLHTPAPRVPGFGEFCRERAGRGLAKASSWPPGRRSLSVGQRV